MGAWVRQVRTLYDLEQLEFGQMIGKGRSAIAMWETGHQPVPAKAIAAIQTAFPRAPEPPVGDSPVTPKATAIGEEGLPFIKYAGVVPCSSEWGDPLSSEELRPIEYKFSGTNRFLCKVTGDSCYPALHQGDMTIWEEDYSPAYGLIVIAERLEDQACTVKELHYDSKERRNRLVPINEESDAPLDGDGWRVTARLVGVIRQGDGPEKTWYLPQGLRKKHLVE